MMTRHTFLSLFHLRFFNVALFFGQCHWMGQIIHKYDHVQSLYKIVSKNPKKKCFQNGNTTCEHNLQVLKWCLIAMHQDFRK